MRIVFFGTGAIGVPSLQALLKESSLEVGAIFTQPDRPAGRGRKLRASPIKDAAGATGIPIYQPERIREPANLPVLESFSPDVIVVAAYGQILPRAVLELPRFGCLNIHASLLPHHRGASPVHAAILSGDRETGITIMQMDEGMDTGDILFQEAIPIAPLDTAGTLHDRLGLLAPAALLRTLALLETGALQPLPQEASLATHAPKLRREDGAMDWRRTARDLDRQIRGLSPWPGAFTLWPGDPASVLKVHQAALVDGVHAAAGSVLDLSEGILVATGDGALRLQEVQLAGGRRLPTAEFLRGNPLQKGQVLGAP